MNCKYIKWSRTLQPPNRCRRWQIVCAAGTSLFLAGCANSSDYADPIAKGIVSPAATLTGTGCAGDGARLTLGCHATQSGSFVVVAGDTLVLSQTVAAGDNAWVDVDHPLFGMCHIELKVNGMVHETGNSKIAIYRTYFVADGAAQKS